jgi:hypothetical protein
LTAVYFAVLGFLLVSCDTTAFRDYVNRHVIAASFSSVEGVPPDSGTGIDSLFRSSPDGTLHIRSAAERAKKGLPSGTVLKVILHNSQRIVYQITYSGRDHGYVENVRQDTDNPSYIYLRLDGNLPLGMLDITLHLEAPAGKATPDDILLPVFCKNFDSPEDETANLGDA